jgi:hypothetical protein
MEVKETKINKTVPMDQSMIDTIHSIMLEHMKETGKPISFGEATRIMITIGISTTNKLMSFGHNKKNLYNLIEGEQ